MTGAGLPYMLAPEGAVGQQHIDTGLERVVEYCVGKWVGFVGCK